MFAQPTITTLNHLLKQSGWALQRLVPFNGKTVHFDVAPFSFACTIQEDGTLREATPDASPDVTCSISPSLLPRLVLQDESAFDQIKSSGDDALVTEIFFLVRNLRWDAAEDLSHFTGDIAAERVVQFAKAKHQQLRDTALNLSQAVAEYWTEERPLLAKPQQLADFAENTTKLRDEVSALELRISKLCHPN